MSDADDDKALSSAALAFDARAAEATPGVRMTSTPPRTPPPYDAAGAREACNGFKGRFEFRPEDDAGFDRLVYVSADPDADEPYEIAERIDQHVAEPLALMLNSLPAALDEIERLRGLLGEIERIRDLPALNWSGPANAMAAKYNLLIDAIDAARIRTILTPKPQAGGASDA